MKPMFAQPVAQEEILAEEGSLVEQSDRAGQRSSGHRPENEAQSAEFRIVIDGKRCLMEVTEQPLPDGNLVSYALDRPTWNLRSAISSAGRDRAERARRVSFGIAILTRHAATSTAGLCTSGAC